MSGHMTSAAVWQIASKDPNWIPIVKRSSCRQCGFQEYQRSVRAVCRSRAERRQWREGEEGGEGRIFRGGRRVWVRWQQRQRRRRRGPGKKEVTCFGLVRPNVASRDDMSKLFSLGHCGSRSQFTAFYGYKRGRRLHIIFGVLRSRFSRLTADL